MSEHPISNVYRRCFILVCVIILVMGALMILVVSCNKGIDREKTTTSGIDSSHAALGRSQQGVQSTGAYTEPVSQTPVAATKTIHPKDYNIKIYPRIAEDSKVEVEMITNIPGSIEVMADLSLAGQASDDIWVGTDERVAINGGKGSVTLDGSRLPTGNYEVEVSFYPGWGFQDDVSRSSGLDREIHTRKKIVLRGTGESSTEVSHRKEGQNWVMTNVYIGQEWDPEFWQRKFGPMQELLVDRGNPDIVRAYYFPSIDMTIIVNAYERQIDTWRTGKAQH